MSRKQRVIEQARRILRTQAAAAEAVESTSRVRPGVDGGSEPEMLESLGGAVTPAVAARAGGAASTELPLARAFAEQGARDVELGIEAMRKVELGRDDEISDQEQFGLEAIILLTGRPAILIQEGDFLEPPKLWAGLKDARDRDQGGHPPRRPDRGRQPSRLGVARHRLPRRQRRRHHQSPRRGRVLAPAARPHLDVPRADGGQPQPACRAGVGVVTLASP